MNKRLKTKDYILIGIFSVLIFIVNAIIGIAMTPVMGTSAMPLISGVCLFFSAIIYLVMSMKVGKKGVLFLLAIVTGLIYTIMGVPIMLPFFAIAGLLGEAVLFKGDGNQYRQVVRQSSAYAAYGMVFGLGAYITVYIYGSDYLSGMYSADMVESLLYFAYSPIWMIGSMVSSFVLTLLGCLFAAKILNKHFIKAGLINK